MKTFHPKLFSTLKGYNREMFIKDITAGIIVAIIALPLSIALAIASGVNPERGLHTAIIAGFIISFLGGSRVQIGGPTGAYMVIVYGVVTTYGLDGLIMATIMAGFMIMAMGLLRMGSVIKFIPHTIITGFTSGIAVTIFSSQVKDFLGLTIEKVPAEFVEKWIEIFKALPTINWTNLAVAVLALCTIIFWPKDKIKVPGSLAALVVTTLIVQLFQLDVPTIGSKFGELSSQLPMPALPAFSYEKFRLLLAPAFTIAVLGAIESLLSAVVADGMIGAKHRSNTELIAQGIANIASGLFGGIPATGAIARTVANIKNGGRTPIAGMTHAVVLLLIMLIFMPLAKLVPLSALAAILVIVAYNMSEWREFVNLLKSPKTDVTVLVVTFLVTVFVDLVQAIEIGLILAAFFFMKRMADVTEIKELSRDAAEDDDSFTPSFDQELITKLPKAIQVYEINGPLFFGAADKFLDTMTRVDRSTKVLILRTRNVPSMDASATHVLTHMVKTCEQHHIHLILSGLNKQPRQTLQKSGLLKRIGEENILANFETALEKAYVLMNATKA